MYQNFIFDLYGTLIDIHTNETKPYLWKKLALWYSFKGAPYTPSALKSRYQILCADLEKEIRERTGKEFPEIKIEEVFYLTFLEYQLKDAKQLAQLTAQIFRTMSIEKLELIPNALRLLKVLKKQGRHIYLLSNAQRVFTEPELKMLSLYDCFDGILYSSDAGVKKPSMEIFETLFTTYQLKKEESVMIGNDFECDIMGAAKFGIDSIYFYTGEFSKSFGRLPQSCKCVQKMEDILNYLK